MAKTAKKTALASGTTDDLFALADAAPRRTPGRAKPMAKSTAKPARATEIGRASCRERV